MGKKALENGIRDAHVVMGCKLEPASPEPCVEKGHVARSYRKQASNMTATGQTGNSRNTHTNCPSSNTPRATDSDPCSSGRRYNHREKEPHEAQDNTFSLDAPHAYMHCPGIPFLGMAGNPE